MPKTQPHSGYATLLCCFFSQISYLQSTGIVPRSTHELFSTVALTSFTVDSYLLRACFTRNCTKAQLPQCLEKAIQFAAYM